MNFRIYLRYVCCLFGLVIVIFSSCNKSENTVLDPSTFGYDYYPVAIGMQWIYKMDSILYSTAHPGIRDTSLSFLREEITDTFRNSRNELVYRVNISFSENQTGPWELISSSFIIPSETELHKIENGLDFVKLIFPVRKNKSWYGNNYIDPDTEIIINGESLKVYDNWFYNYNYIDQAEQIGSFNFSNVLKITEADDENILAKRFSIAKYAKQFGLVYREQWILDTQELDDNIPFELRAEKGMILYQTLISHN